ADRQLATLGLQLGLVRILDHDIDLAERRRQAPELRAQDTRSRGPGARQFVERIAGKICAEIARQLFEERARGALPAIATESEEQIQGTNERRVRQRHGMGGGLTAVDRIDIATSLPL